MFEVYYRILVTCYLIVSKGLIKPGRHAFNPFSRQRYPPDKLLSNAFGL